LLPDEVMPRVVRTVSVNVVAGLVMLVCCIAAVSGCATSMAKITQTATTRAAFDFECPEASLQAGAIGDTTLIGATPQSPGVERTVVGVTGCDRKAVYVVDCVTGACNATLNADVAPAAAASPAP
jgi:hypothetical protein